MMSRRKAVITGASSGIGRATAVRFASDGYDVCLNARRTRAAGRPAAESAERRPSDLRGRLQ